MTIKEFLETVGQYIGEFLAKRFTGKIVITLNIRSGGIANVNVTVDHALQKPVDLNG